MAEAQKQFEYVVRDRQGKVSKGKIQAPNQNAVAGKLREMGMATISITETSSEGLNTEISIPGLSDKIGLKELAIMSRQMSTMISAGLSLLRTLTILAEQTESKPLARVIGEVRNDVQQGVSLSSGLNKHPEVFPPLMINMIKAGEVGGFLEQSLISVAENFEAELKLRQTVKSAMTYPVVVLIIAILAVIGMLLFIVPVFEGMFDGLGGSLPAPTQFLVWLSGVMKTLGPLLIVGLVALSVWWNKNKNKASIRAKVDPFKLKMPVFGSLMQKIAISRFTRNFGTMMHAGVPLLQSLDIVGQTAGNYVIEQAVRDIQDAVRRGETLSGPLAKHEVFPPMVVQMISVGEDAGSLELMLHKISDFYDQEVDATTKQLASLIEPLMIVTIGAIVGGMIVALYMPIFSVFELVG